MGILSNFLVADANQGPEIGQSLRPADKWPCLEGWKGIETIKLSTLHLCIAGKPLLVEETIALSQKFELVGGNEEEGPWVLRFPTDVVSSIASLSPSQLAQVAQKWCETDELQMDGWSENDAKTYLNGIQPFAERALTPGKALYLWLSL